MEYISYLQNIDWRLLLLLGGILFVIMMILINFFWDKTPKYIREFISYVNLREFKDINNILQYSRYFSRHKNVKWLYAYSGKREGKELHFAAFVISQNTYMLFLIKEEVKPMMVTNEKESYDWPITVKGNITGHEYNFYAKEKYLIEKITTSNDLRIGMGDLFKGENNCLEFTDLNQVLVITDYEFKNSKELIEYFIRFFKLKDKM